MATREQVIRQLVTNRAKRDLAELYADALFEYLSAQEDIDRNGSIVLHPRTGDPIDNPFTRVRDRAREQLKKLTNRMDTSGVWELVDRSPGRATG